MMYAELQVTSNFTFLRGASHPEELVETAKELGHTAIAVTDRNTLAGIVRFHAAAKDADLQLIIGARLDFEDAPSVLCFPTDKAAYARLSNMLTKGKRRAEKGECILHLDDLIAYGAGQIIASLALPTSAEHLRTLKKHFDGRIYLAAQNLYRGDDASRIAALAVCANEHDIPLIATNDVLYHTSSRRPLQDALTCIQNGCTIFEAGAKLLINAERHLKSPDDMAALFQDHSDAIRNISDILRACTFSLDELKYEYPSEPVPDGSTAHEELTRLTWLGAEGRYPDGIPDKIRHNIEYELKLIGDLNYAPYFLTVDDIVRFARSRDILCQGRGRRRTLPFVIVWVSRRLIPTTWIYCSNGLSLPHATSHPISMSISNTNAEKKSSNTSMENTVARAPPNRRGGVLSIAQCGARNRQGHGAVD